MLHWLMIVFMLEGKTKIGQSALGRVAPVRNKTRL